MSAENPAFEQKRQELETRTRQSLSDTFSQSSFPQLIDELAGQTPRGMEQRGYMFDFGYDKDGRLRNAVLKVRLLWNCDGREYIFFPGFVTLSYDSMLISMDQDETVTVKGSSIRGKTTFKKGEWRQNPVAKQREALTKAYRHPVKFKETRDTDEWLREHPEIRR